MSDVGTGMVTVCTTRYCSMSFLNGDVIANTTASWQTECCRRSLRAQLSQKFASCCSSSGSSVIALANMREVVMDCLAASSVISMQSMPLSSRQVSTPGLLNSERTKDSLLSANCKALVIPAAASLACALRPIPHTSAISKVESALRRFSSVSIMQAPL